MKRIHGPSNISEDNEETISDDKINKMEKRIYKLEKRKLDPIFVNFVTWNLCQVLKKMGRKRNII